MIEKAFDRDLDSIFSSDTEQIKQLVVRGGLHTLNGIDLSDLDLSEQDLSDLDLVNATFRNSALVGADLRRCRLVNADLTDANLAGADFSGARLPGVRLSGATVDERTSPNIIALVRDHRSTVPQPPAAFWFLDVDGHIVTLPQDFATPDSEFAAQTHEEVRAKAMALRDQLLRSNQYASIVTSVERLLDALGETPTEIRPGLLRSRARAIEAAAFASKEGFRDLYSDLNDLALSLQDLQACYPIIREIEAEALALKLQSANVELVEQNLRLISEAARRTDAVADETKDDLAALEPDIAAAPNRIVKTRQVADDALIKSNFVAAVLRPLADRAKAEAQDLGRLTLKGSKEGIKTGLEKAARAATLGSLTALAGLILGPLGVLGMTVGVFAPASESVKRLKKGGHLDRAADDDADKAKPGDDALEEDSADEDDATDDKRS